MNHLKGEDQQGRQKAAPPLPGEELGFAVIAVGKEQNGFGGSEQKVLGRQRNQR